MHYRKNCFIIIFGKREIYELYAFGMQSFSVFWVNWGHHFSLRIKALDHRIGMSGRQGDTTELFERLWTYRS